MPSDRKIAAQLKKELVQAKRDQVNMVLEAVYSILESSSLFGSSLWPVNGFGIGYRGHEKIDTITIGITIDLEIDYNSLRFNIWGKPARVLKQRRQLVLIFDQAFYEGIFFEPRDREFINELCHHYHGDYIMDMLNFKFTINP